MNDSINDLEQLRRDWQEGATPPPEVSVKALRRRLSRQWWLVGFELLAFLACTVVVGWAATRMDGWLDWLYWLVFASVFVFTFLGTLKLRRRSLWRDDDSVRAVLDHARREARAREIGGAYSVRLVPLMWLFVFAWMVVVGLESPEPWHDYLLAQWELLAFATGWFAMGLLLGAWMREKGRRQLLELDRIVRDLED